MFLTSFTLEECVIVLYLTGQRKMQSKHKNYIKHHYIGCAVIFTSGSIFSVFLPEEDSGTEKQKVAHSLCL